MPALRCRGFNVWSRLNRVPLWSPGMLVSSPTQLSNFICCCCNTFTRIFSKEWAEQRGTSVSLIKRSPEFSRRLLPTSSPRAKYRRNLKSGVCISIDSSRLTWKHHLQSVNCWTSVCLSYNMNYSVSCRAMLCSLQWRSSGGWFRKGSAYVEQLHMPQ